MPGFLHLKPWIMKKRLLLLLVLFSLLHISFLSAQGANPIHAGSPSLFDFFYQQQDSLPILRLETDWGQLVKEKLAEEYLPGVLRAQGQDGKAVEMAVSLRARGNARKQVCLFPPIKIKATKKQLAALGLHPERKLKLVLPCQTGKKHEDRLLKEALAYQLYEAIYPIHHRTKIIRLEAWQKGKEKYAFYALLVEDESELAGRVQGKIAKQSQIRTIDLEREAYVRMCFFQYMIANTDWTVPNSHNLQVLQLPGYEKLIPVPYDFDFAGFVDADYAIPRSTLPIDDVTERLFLGKYVTREEALECAKFYVSRKERLFQICRDFTLLQDKSNDWAQAFLSGFFDVLEDEQLVLKTFAAGQAGE